MRLSCAAALIALAASQCAAKKEPALLRQYRRADPQKGRQPLRERKLSPDKKHTHHDQTETITGTTIPPEDHERNGYKETRQANPPCSVCGEDMEVGDSGGLVTFPGQIGSIPCGILQNMGKVGLIPRAQCEVLPQLISATCKCQAAVVTTTTAATASTTDDTLPMTTITQATTQVTKLGQGKASKNISMSLPAKAGKSIHIKATVPSDGGWGGSIPSGGKSKKNFTTVTTKSTKSSKMIAGNASSKSTKSGSVHGWNTFDAKAEKVTSSKAAKSADSKAEKSSSSASSGSESAGGASLYDVSSSNNTSSGSGMSMSMSMQWASDD